tara:strand:+ start:350 stop:472 length:123 start_codon:yes stop_codon:yes gene_type:complete
MINRKKIILYRLFGLIKPKRLTGKMFADFYRSLLMIKEDK